MFRRISGFLGSMRRSLARAVIVAGLPLLVMFAMNFTQYPWRIYKWLSDQGDALSDQPDYIVMLGGGGIPSESGLMRSYYAAEAARRFEDATVVIALPDEGTGDRSSASKTRAELVMRGVAPERIIMESKGRNTREQALNLAELLDIDPAEARIVIVTSPEHMRRAIASFRKVDFGRVSGMSAFCEAVAADMSYDPNDLGGTCLLLPSVDGMLMLRYQFWNNLHYQVRSGRELLALLYYKFMGWI